MPFKDYCLKKHLKIQRGWEWGAGLVKIKSLLSKYCYMYTVYYSQNSLYHFFTTNRKYMHGVTLGAVGLGTLLAIPMNLLVARRVNEEEDDNPDENSKVKISGQNVES